MPTWIAVIVWQTTALAGGVAVVFLKVLSAQGAAMRDLAMLDAPALAVALESAITRLGQLGQGGIDALVERLANAPECPAFDAGVDLIDAWIGEVHD